MILQYTLLLLHDFVLYVRQVLELVLAEREPIERVLIVQLQQLF